MLSSTWLQALALLCLLLTGCLDEDPEPNAWNTDVDLRHSVRGVDPALLGMAEPPKGYFGGTIFWNGDLKVSARTHPEYGSRSARLLLAARVDESGWYSSSDSADAFSAHRISWVVSKSKRFFEFVNRVNYKVRGLCQAGNGHVLFYGHYKTGETIIESWRLQEPFVPNKPSNTGTLGLDSESFSHEIGTLPSFDGAEGTETKVTVKRSRVLQRDLGGAPQDMCSTAHGEILFLTVLDPETKVTSLLRLDPEDDWAVTVLKTSEECPILREEVVLILHHVGRTKAFTLTAQVPLLLQGAQEDTDGLRNILCWEDLNGDGILEREWLMKDNNQCREYMEGLHKELQKQRGGKR